MPNLAASDRQAGPPIVAPHPLRSSSQNASVYILHIAVNSSYHILYAPGALESHRETILLLLPAWGSDRANAAHTSSEQRKHHNIDPPAWTF